LTSYRSTIAKTIIWRSIATIITILSGWFVSGNWKFGLAIGGIDTVFKTLGYFGFERFWLKLQNKKK
tara:strand:+ start:248 stop:448 length:201 start_codon:yes stop_codon:yes gene_type:complete